MNIDITALAKKNAAYAIAMRRELHKWPEGSGEEVETRKILVRELEAMGVPYELVKGTGVLAVVEGGKPGKTHALRCDMDGLPVQENKMNLCCEKTVLSERDGYSHSCGHDAHMGMMLATIKSLLEVKDELEGRIVCCFEEGEELNTGVFAMIEALKKYEPEDVLALHTYAMLDSGYINIAAGPRMSGISMFHVKFHGKGGHSSRPDLANNPIIAAVKTIDMYESCFLNRLSPEQTVVLGVCMFHSGTQNNAFPDDAEIEGSVRYFNEEEGAKGFAMTGSIAESVAANYGVSVEFMPKHRRYNPPVVNDKELANRVTDSVARNIGSEYIKECDAWYASECFPHYGKYWPVSMGFLGIRNEAKGCGAGHHNGQFDIDEDALWLGVAAELCFALGA